MKSRGAGYQRKRKESDGDESGAWVTVFHEVIWENS